jgi:hypothetical protein
MPRKCTICCHPEHNEIDIVLISSDSYRTIADRFGVSVTSLKRHAVNHLPPTLTKSAESKEITKAEKLLEEVKQIKARTYAILNDAGKEKKYMAALAAIRELRNIIELLFKAAYEIREERSNLIVNSPEWIKLRTAILTVLEKYPDAYRAMVKAVRDGKFG